MNEKLKRVEVVAAVLIHTNLVFACQRGYGEFKDMWEFPGENNFKFYGRRLVDVDMIGWAILTSLAILIRNLLERCDLTTFEVVCIKTNSG